MEIVILIKYCWRKAVLKLMYPELMWKENPASLFLIIPTDLFQFGIITAFLRADITHVGVWERWFLGRTEQHYFSLSDAFSCPMLMQHLALWDANIEWVSACHHNRVNNSRNSNSNNLLKIILDGFFLVYDLRTVSPSQALPDPSVTSEMSETVPFVFLEFITEHIIAPTVFE